MKVVVFSDVQGNLSALEAALEIIDHWQPDMVAMAGDLINRGPESAQCLALFHTQRQRHGWLPVNGNHETWVLRCGREAPSSSIEREMRRIADWTWQQVASQYNVLCHWPDHLCFDAPQPGHWVHVTHGTLAGNRDGISAVTTDESLIGKLPEQVALFITGHTHKVHQRHTQGIDVVNVGSVGSPFDRDPRGSLGQFSFYGGRWHIEIVRFEYDRTRTERAFYESGFLDYGGPLAHLIFLEWQRADLLMGGWRRRYEPAVLAGEIDLETSVKTYLADVL